MNDTSAAHLPNEWAMVLSDFANIQGLDVVAGTQGCVPIS